MLSTHHGGSQGMPSVGALQASQPDRVPAFSECIKLTHQVWFLNNATLCLINLPKVVGMDWVTEMRACLPGLRTFEAEHLHEGGDGREGNGGCSGE